MMDPRTRPLSVSEELPVNWASVVSGGMSKHARSDVVRASTAATYMDVHTWTFRLWQSATPAHQGLLCLSSPVTLQTEQLHAAHWHLSLSLQVHRYTAHEAAAMARIQIRDRSLAACHRGRLFWARYHSLHQSAPVCTSLHHACRRFARPGEQLARPCPHVEIVC